MNDQLETDYSPLATGIDGHPACSILPHFAQFQVLGALQRRNLYSGTVPADVIAARRRRNKAARAARRLNRSR